MIGYNFITLNKVEQVSIKGIKSLLYFIFLLREFILYFNLDVILMSKV